MEQTGSSKTPDKTQAVEHVAEAHALLKDLRDELAEHPQLEDAILKLEIALNLLTTKSGGML